LRVKAGETKSSGKVGALERGKINSGWTQTGYDVTVKWEMKVNLRGDR